LERVLAVLRSETADAAVRVETPTQNLESYFLGVVEAARASEAQTSGALSGSRVAAYLRGDAEPGSRAERVLERLTRGPSGPEPDVTVASPAETVNHGKLERLVKGQPEALAEGKKEVAEGAPLDVDLGAAEEKLSTLLRKPKP
jgi:hypothetical protein